MAELAPGTDIAGFIVKERLGKGGMGEVFLVHDPRLAVDRALKLISLSGPGFDGNRAEMKVYRERFLREARTLAKLRHPNIIPVQEIGEVNGDPYIVMTHFPSLNARRWLREQSPDIERVRRIGLQLASALAYAHESGVLHRDIKLTNTLVGKDDEAMLIDFGLAKSKSDENLTRTGRTMGTSSYLAPEYIRASMKQKPEHTVLTDLWAFGCILYALTCRRPPFLEKEDLKLFGLILDAQFPSVKSLRPDVSSEWATLVHSLMEPDPARRLQSARDAMKQLEALAAKPALIAPPPIDLPPPVDGVSELAGNADANDDASPERKLAETVAGRKPPPPATQDTSTPAASESLFDHASAADSEAKNPTPATANIAQPSFQLPPDPPTTAKARAKRSLLFPVAAAFSVLLVGGALILWADRVSARSKRRSSGEYVDPTESERQTRAKHELAELDHERAKRTKTPAPPHEPMPLLPLVFTSAAVDPPSVPAAPPPPQAKARTTGPSARHVEPAPSAPDDPWARRYGTRTNFNTSPTAPSSAAATATAALAPIAGVKIPVRVKDAIASAPAGPVIAVVETATKIGNIEIPKNAELHGKTTGTSGPRILVEFTFAIINGRNVSLQGSALGSDGRAGVPGAKTLGGASDVAAGAASGGLQAVVDLAAGAAKDPLAQAIIRGGGTPAANKTTNLNNEEQIVITNRGARFFVYIESFS